MTYFDILKRLAAEADMSLTAVAAAAGRERSFIPSYTSKGNTPTLTVANELAAPLGYALALVPTDDVPPSALLIDPPEQSGDASS